MSDTTDLGRATHAGIKQMMGYPFQAIRLRRGCRKICPRLATATAATPTHSTAAHARYQVTRGTPAIPGGVEISQNTTRLACMSIATSRLPVRS